METHDAATRLWLHLEALDGNLSERSTRDAKRGELLYKLNCLYSERKSGGSRRSSGGHGTFQAECIARGYKPRRVREWVRDHEVRIGLRPASDSTAAKQSARRQRSTRADAYARGWDNGLASAHLERDPLTVLAALLPFEAWQAAYRVAAKQIHPDLGGNCEQMQSLNAAWAEVEKFFQSKDADVSTESATKQ